MTRFITKLISAEESETPQPKGSIAYPEFVAAVAATAQATLLLLTVVKYISIMNDLDVAS